MQTKIIHAVGCLIHGVMFVASVSAGETILVSVDSNETQSFTGGSWLAPRNSSTSADGRLVAFHSFANDLVPDDSNMGQDVFLRDIRKGNTTRISVDSHGNQAWGTSSRPCISSDGRFVAFDSGASNLVPNDDNGETDVFLRDNLDGSISRVSVNSNEIAASGGDSDKCSISGDGRFIAFSSAATNLVPNHNNGTDDIFLRDLTEGTTSRISVNSNEIEASGNYGGSFPSISADGRYVAFSSSATNLVPDDTNLSRDVFLRDVIHGTTTRISVDSNEREASGIFRFFESDYPKINADGRFVVFRSGAINLVPNDINGLGDIFMRDVVNGTTELISVDSNGVQASGQGSNNPSISANGRFVAFDSDANNLVPNDNNDIHDIFLRDILEGSTTRVSVDSNGNEVIGAQGSTITKSPSISADGRYIAFSSSASNLVDNDSDGGYEDVFLRDQGADCDINDQINRITLHDNTWTMVAPPCLPGGGASIGAIFADDIPGELFNGSNPSTATWAVWFFDGPTQRYSLASADELLTTGMGVWVLQSTGNDRVLDVPEESRSGPSNYMAENTCSPYYTGCFLLRLNNLDSGSTVWTIGGIPFSIKEGVSFNDLRVVTDTGTCADSSDGCTMAEANTEQIVSDIFFRYNSKTESYDQLKTGSTLHGWDAFWISIFPEIGPLNPAVLIPEYSAANSVFR